MTNKPYIVYVVLIAAILAASCAVNVPQPGIASQVTALNRAVNGMADGRVMVFTNGAGEFISVWRTRGGFIVTDITDRLLEGGGTRLTLEEICGYLKDWESIPATEIPPGVAAKIATAAKVVEAIGVSSVGDLLSGLVGTIWYPCFDCLPPQTQEETL